MVCQNSKYIRKAMHVARQLNVLADECESEAIDDGCAVLVGVVRDCAYKIRAQAEREMLSRKANGAWESAEVAGE
ncbi:MAG: hypothetical protein O3A51_01170 [Verrucomicrobia bacterium]|nr:hypothetical protein [Verrucomicrobiota bacterium]